MLKPNVHKNIGDVGDIIKVGVNRIMGQLPRVSESEVGHFIWGGVKHLMKRQSILLDGKGLILSQSLNVHQLGGSGDMLPWKIMKLRSSKIAGNVHFSIYFCIFKFFRESN